MKHRLAVAALVAAACGPAHAVPVSIEYVDVVSLSIIAGVNAGDTVSITVTLDNGGAGIASQTWTAGDLVSVVFDFGNGALHTTFTSPFGAGLTVGSGSFATDAAGMLTSVMTDWDDVNAGGDYTSNGSAPIAWYLNGQNPVYFEPAPGNTFFSISLGNVPAMLSVAGWSQPIVAVPEPAALALVALGLAGIAARRSARRPQAAAVRSVV